MNRETRSGRIFAQWNGHRAVAASPWFDFALGMQSAIDRADADGYADDCDPILELSPHPSPAFITIPLPPPLSLTSPSSGLASLTSPLSTPQACPPTEPHASTSTSPATHVNKKLKRQNPIPNNHAPLTEAQARRKAKKKAKSRENGRRRRAEENDKKFSHHAPRPSTHSKYVEPSIPLHTAMDTEDAKVASTAYVGLNDFRTREKHTWTLEDLVGEKSKFKFKLVPWNGETATPLVSDDGTLLGVLAGHCDANDWRRLHEEAVQALEEARRDCRYPPDASSHRRGRFSTLRCGVSYGGGQERPANLKNNKTNTKIAKRLNALEPFRRLAGFATSVMATWAPDLHAYYTQSLNALHQSDRSLKRIFQGSVFSSSTYNLGPQTVCFKHTDFANLPFGWCGITAFGSYDPRKGGHLILWDCHLVIEFPPGSTVLIPSAVVAHSNVPISEGETRYSFTQYTAGHLFQWVANGYRMATSYKASLSPAEFAEYERRNSERWKFGLSLVPKFPLEDDEQTE